MTPPDWLDGAGNRRAAPFFGSWVSTTAQRREPTGGSGSEAGGRAAGRGRPSLTYSRRHARRESHGLGERYSGS